jgi:hypothetical protein
MIIFCSVTFKLASMQNKMLTKIYTRHSLRVKDREKASQEFIPHSDLPLEICIHHENVYNPTGVGH